MLATRVLAALGLLLLYAGLCLWVWQRHRRQQMPLLPQACADAQPLLVLHASQTGQAEALALQTAQSLHAAGLPVRLAALGELDAAALAASRRALFIVSTAGEGDAPDSAAGFVRRCMALPQGPDLRHLQVAVLALGDRSYRQFCGFGQALSGWLEACGARALFPCIELDRMAPEALLRWREQIQQLGGSAAESNWAAPEFAPWQLLQRQHLNPGSPGGAVFHLQLRPAGGAALPDWQAGDLVQLALPQAGQATALREYSIASVPEQGGLELLVRQCHRSDGALGPGSGLLTEGLELGACVSLRLRPNRAFRIAANAQRRLILIGNGVGLAGLRAHLAARARQDYAPPAWLLFGERAAAHDAHWRVEIEAWQAQGLLAHVDWAFSRDPHEACYVQQRLSEQAQRLRDWVAAGAAIYICGSGQGMAEAVQAVLQAELGPALLQQLQSEGRLRRDVF